MAIHSDAPPRLSGIEPGHPASARVLVAEDPFVSSFLQAVLQKRGHHVVMGEAGHLSELLRQGKIDADVVITNRPEVFLDFAGVLPLLYIAANPDPELAARFSICRALPKPFRNDDLVSAVEQLADTVVP